MQGCDRQVARVTAISNYYIHFIQINVSCNGNNNGRGKIIVRGTTGDLPVATLQYLDISTDIWGQVKYEKAIDIFCNKG